MSGISLLAVSTFTRKVVFGIPSGDGFNVVTLTARFKIGPSSDREGLRSNREILDEHLEAVEGLDVTGAEAVDQVKRHDVAAVAFAKAYITAINEGADRKN